MRGPISLVLLGDIAAGKGTQAKILVRKFRLRLIETGAFTRKYWTGTSKVSRRLEKTKLGKLTPSDIIKKFLKTSLGNLPKNRSVLLDGGKMPSEARLIYNIFKRQGRKVLVNYLHTPHSEIYRRLRGRYYCSRTGELITLYKGPERCPKCGSSLIKRADDDPKAIRNRIAYYDKIYSKTVKFWRGQELLKIINGQQPIPKVTKDIVQTINRYYGAH